MKRVYNAVTIVMGTNAFYYYIVTVTSLVTIVTNDHLQLSACNEETDPTFRR
jgi:hypothetical protein